MTRPRRRATARTGPRWDHLLTTALVLGVAYVVGTDAGWWPTTWPSWAHLPALPPVPAVLGGSAR